MPAEMSGSGEKERKLSEPAANILFVDIDLIEYYIKCRNVNGNLDKRASLCIWKGGEG